jgi:hypothetical protein
MTNTLKDRASQHHDDDSQCDENGNTRDSLARQRALPMKYFQLHDCDPIEPMLQVLWN